jgi:hypothetical protein
VQVENNTTRNKTQNGQTRMRTELRMGLCGCQSALTSPLRVRKVLQRKHRSPPSGMISCNTLGRVCVRVEYKIRFPLYLSLLPCGRGKIYHSTMVLNIQAEVPQALAKSERALYRSMYILEKSSIVEERLRKAARYRTAQSALYPHLLLRLMQHVQAGVTGNCERRYSARSKPPRK